MQKLTRLTEKTTIKSTKSTPNEELQKRTTVTRKAKIDQSKWLNWGVPVTKDLSEKEAIEMAKKNGGLFTDERFPPSDTSLGIAVKQQCRNCFLMWKRPSEFLTKPKMFIDGSGSGDVAEGSISNSWFLGALAVIATRDDLLTALCVSQHPEYGFYQFKFFKNNQWYIVTIDDFLPVFQTRSGLKLLSAHCVNPNEIWVPLIEKAYAKLLGSYSSLTSGWQAEAFVDLTGGVGERIEIQEVALKDNGFYLWKLLETCCNEKWLMGCSAVTSNTYDFKTLGLLKGRCYSILFAWEYHSNDGSVHRLLQLRNPWKLREWTGKWCDNDASWTQDAVQSLTQKTNYEFDAFDGCFWIEYEDWKRYFTRLVICRLYDDMYGEQFKRHSIFAQWKGHTAGGCKAHPTWCNNPQFGFTVEQKCRICIALVQEDTKIFTHALKKPYVSIAFTIFFTSDNTKRKMEPDLNKIGSTGVHHARHEVSFSQDFLPGKYIIVPSTFDPGEERPFIIVLYTQEQGNVQLSQLPDAVDPMIQTEERSTSLVTKIKGRASSFKSQKKYVKPQTNSMILSASKDVPDDNKLIVLSETSERIEKHPSKSRLLSPGVEEMTRTNSRKRGSSKRNSDKTEIPLETISDKPNRNPDQIVVSETSSTGSSSEVS